MGFTHSVWLQYSTVQYQYIRWWKCHYSVYTVNCSTCCPPSNVWLSNFICNHFYVHCMFGYLRNDCLEIYSLVSGDQEIDIVHAVIKFDQMCRGCWIDLFYFLLYCIVVHTKFIYKSLVSKHSVFHLLNSSKKKMFRSQKFIAELLLLLSVI